MNIMKKIALASLGLLMMGLSACQDTITDPGPEPTAASMSFKQGARYEFTSHRTSPSTGTIESGSERQRTWTLVNKSASVQGRSNVAIYVDSVFSGGTIINVADSVYLQQQAGSNFVYRFASLAPELDFAMASAINIDLGREWMQEARLNATTARWFVGEAADTVQMDLSIPGFQGMKVGVADSAIASVTEAITINGQSYTATKTTHKLELSLSAIVAIPIIGNTPIKLTSASLNRTTWIVPELGAIVKEVREGKVLDVSTGTYGSITVPGFQVPVPGYVSTMTRVIATGT
jgi:hypothetical protein